jgi:phosphoribosylanthranilate isomerase
LRTLADVQVVAAAGAAYFGLVFFAKSPRNLTLAQGRALALAAPPGLAKVALTVDAEDATLDAMTEAMPLDMLQLHGHETPERVLDVKKRFGLPVMKVLSMAEAADLNAIPLYETVADRLLFDAKPPKTSVLPGGNGVSFDWGLLAGLSKRLPYMLSGGLDAGNVAKALAMTGAWGVDVSSGVETAPGQKDPALIRRFMAAARSAAV